MRGSGYVGRDMRHLVAPWRACRPGRAAPHHPYRVKRAFRSGPGAGHTCLPKSHLGDNRGRLSLSEWWLLTINAPILAELDVQGVAQL